MTYAIIAKDINNTPIRIGCRIKMVGDTIREEFKGREALVTAPNEHAVLYRLMDVSGDPMIAVEEGVVKAKDVEVIAAPEDDDALGYDISIIGFDHAGKPIRAGDAVKLVGESVSEQYKGDVNLVVEAQDQAKLLACMTHQPILSLDDGMVCAASAVENISSVPVAETA